jgi:hypothetical protein
MARALERHRRLGVLNHDQIIVLALETGRGKVHGERIMFVIRPASSNLNPLALCYLDLDASPMPARPVAVDHGASLCPVASLI